MEKSAYAPGESGEIKAVFNSRAFSGNVTKKIRVVSNSRNMRVTYLRFYANVVFDLRPAESTIYFRRMFPSKTYEQKVPIENNMGKPLVLGEVEVQGEPDLKKIFSVKVQLGERVGERETLRFRVNMKELSVSHQNPYLNVLVHTNSKKKPVLTFRLEFGVPKPIVVNPSSLFLFGINPDTKRVRELQVKSNSGQPISVSKVESELNWLSFEIIQEDELQTSVWLGVEKPESHIVKSTDGRPSMFSSTIVITVQSGSETEELTVPIRGSISDK